MSVRATAPLRLDFAGGWTDVPEFADREGGVVVAAAISLSVRVDFLLGGDKIKFAAEDLDVRRTFASAGAIEYDGTLDLHKAALNMLPVTGGIEILSRSDAPDGSGLGASGALDVALLAGLARCRQEQPAREETAELGFQLETQILGLAGGRQDQLCAALGGFHEFRFSAGGVEARRLEVDAEISRDLGEHMVLVYSGHSHFSSATHECVWREFAAGDPVVTDALLRLRDGAPRASEALLACDWRALGAVIDENWRQQQRLHTTIATDRSRRIEEAAKGAGAWGVKATGAGAGGCLVVLAPAERRSDVIDALRGEGGEILPAGFAEAGVTVEELSDAAADG